MYIQQRTGFHLTLSETDLTQGVSKVSIWQSSTTNNLFYRRMTATRNSIYRWNLSVTAASDFYAIGLLSSPKLCIDWFLKSSVLFLSYTRELFLWKCLWQAQTKFWFLDKYPQSAVHIPLKIFPTLTPALSKKYILSSSNTHRYVGMSVWNQML